VTHGTHDASHIEAEISAEHDAHDDHGGGHGHGHDPNEGVLRGEAPTPAWLGATVVIALVTLAACVWLAFRIG